MHPAPNFQPHGLLFLAAAPAEAAAIALALECPTPLSDLQPAASPHGPHLLQTGVGKVNAALAAARFVSPDRHHLVINLGLAGALPDPASSPLCFPLRLLSPVIATSSIYADEGIASPDRFITMAEAGFPPQGASPNAAFDAMSIPAAAHAIAWAAAQLPTAARAPIATVSTCSGTDALALATVSRTYALAEAMEGAAIAHTIARLHPRVDFLEIRVISNTTGDRSRQEWRLKPALAQLTEITRALIAPHPRPHLQPQPSSA